MPSAILTAWCCLRLARRGSAARVAGAFGSYVSWTTPPGEGAYLVGNIGCGEVADSVVATDFASADADCDNGAGLHGTCGARRDYERATRGLASPIVSSRAPPPACRPGRWRASSPPSQ